MHRERDEKERGDNVGERERARDLPLELREGDREDGREEEALDDRGAPGDDARSVEGKRRHGVES